MHARLSKERKKKKAHDCSCAFNVFIKVYRKNVKIPIVEGMLNIFPVNGSEEKKKYNDKSK